MTADERSLIRALRNERSRARRALDKVIELERAEVRFCAHCGAVIPPERIGTASRPAIYCQPSHRQYAYRRRRLGAMA